MSDAKGGMSKEGISLPGEAEDKCCWFVPIKIGVYIIGAMMCLWAVRLILQCLDNIGANFIWGVLYGVAAAPIILGAYFYIRFFMDQDDKDRRLGLQKACMLVILSAMFSAGLALVQFFIVAGFPFGYFLEVCISSACLAIVYFYYAGVAKRFASQA